MKERKKEGAERLIKLQEQDGEIKTNRENKER